MENNFDRLVEGINISPLSTDILHQIIFYLKQQTDESLSLVVSQSFRSLLILQHWAWQLLTQDSQQWINQTFCLEVLHTLASFIKRIIFECNTIGDDIKASLVIPENIDQVSEIFQQIERSTDDNDPFINIASVWFDNHSYFIQENPHCNVLPITDHINQYIAHNYIVSEQYKIYLNQLSQRQLPQSVFTAKMLFYIKTCSFSIFSYMGVRIHSFPYTANELLHCIGDDYVDIIHIHSRNVELWSKELLACMTQLVSFTAGLCWWDGENRTHTKLLFPTEQMICSHVEDLIHIIAYIPFQTKIKAVRSNDETSLIDATLTLLLTIVQTQNINWFFRATAPIRNTLLPLAEISVFNEICIRAYGILGEFLTDEQLKDLKIGNTLGGFFFNMLEEAWHHPTKKYKQIPIEYLLRGFLNLSKHDFIQQRTADFNRMPLVIDICDVYPMVYDIIWALSFNQDIQQQLRASSSFMSKLVHLNKTCDNEQMRKITNGILWNLEINHEDHSTSGITDGKTFDIMISYSHKEKTLCKQLYEELTKGGYRVWIDFDQMHGNVMDAMAQAIDRSHTIIICMSENYRNSNFCRAEAQYAFQRQRKIVPVLLQKHYKPDGWLLFLTGQLLYIDFTKYEFERAVEMLLKEFKSINITKISVAVVRPKENSEFIPSIQSTALNDASTQPNLPDNILEWTQTHVHDWLIRRNLPQMSRLLTNCDGRSLVYLSGHLKRDESQQNMRSLQEDSIRRTGETLSLIELSCLQSLIDQEKRTTRLKLFSQPTKNCDKSDP